MIYKLNLLRVNTLESIEEREVEGHVEASDHKCGDVVGWVEREDPVTEEIHNEDTYLRLKYI